MPLTWLVPFMLSPVLWVIVGTGLGTIAALALGVLMVQGKRVPVVLGPVGVAIPVLAAIAVATWSLGGADPLASVAGAVGARMFLGVLLPPVVALFLLFLAVVGIGGPGRSYVGVGLGLCAAFATSATVIAGGYQYDNPPFALARGAVYAVLGVVAALSLGGADPEHRASPEAGAVAGLVYPLVVAAGEGAEAVLAHLLILLVMPVVPVDQRAEFVDRCLSEVAPEKPWFWAAIAVSASMALIGVGRAAWSPGPRRWQALAGLLWLALPPLLLVVAIPTPAQLAAVGDVVPLVQK